METLKKIFSHRISIIVFQFLITAFFLYLTFADVNYQLVWRSLTGINYWWLLLYFILEFFSFLALAERENYLLKGIFQFSFRTLLQGVFIGFIGNNVLPLRGGEFLKVYFWKKITKKSYISLLSIALLERIQDLLMLIILFFLSSKSLLYQLGVRIELIFILIAVLTAPIGLLVFLDWKYGKAFKLHHAVHRFIGERITGYIDHFLDKMMIGFRVLGSWKNMLISMSFTTAYWILNWLLLLILLTAFHLHIHFGMSLVIILAIAIGTMIPSAPGYVGTYDYFAKNALVLYGVNHAVATSFAIVSHVMSLVPYTIIGFGFIYPVFNRLLKENKLLK